MSDKISLDKESFKALAVDSRINILKELNKRRKTLSELSTCLNLGTSSVKEHLEILQKAELIKKIEEGRKWKYYELTWKGKNIVDPTEAKIFITLAVSLLALTGAFYMFIQKFPQTFLQTTQIVSAPVMHAKESTVSAAGTISDQTARDAAESDISGSVLTSSESIALPEAETVSSSTESSELVGATNESLGEAVPDTIPQITETTELISTQFPWPELLLTFALLAVVAFCIGYLIRKKY